MRCRAAPSIIDDYCRVGKIYEAAGEREKAITAFQEVLSTRPDDIYALEALDRLENYP